MVFLISVSQHAHHKTCHSVIKISHTIILIGYKKIVILAHMFPWQPHNWPIVTVGWVQNSTQSCTLDYFGLGAICVKHARRWILVDVARCEYTELTAAGGRRITKTTALLVKYLPSISVHDSICAERWNRAGTRSEICMYLKSICMEYSNLFSFAYVDGPRRVEQFI